MNRPPDDDGADLAGLIHYLERRTGLSFDGSQRPRLLRALRSAMRAAGDTDPERYEQRLSLSPDAFDALVARLTVGESYFFRDRRQIELLREVAIADVLDRRGPAHTLTLWSAGCASGQEAYTAAIVLDEHPRVRRFSVLGTDLSANALATAGRGVYERWSLRGLDEAAQQHYFEAARNRFSVAARYRPHVRFQQLGLHEHPPVGEQFDIVLCRNVLMYLTPSAIERAAATLRDALRPDGWLIVGASDPPLPANGLVRVRTDYGIAYRLAAHAPVKRKVTIARTPRRTPAAVLRPHPRLRPAAARRRTEPAVVPVADSPDRVACARAELKRGNPSTAEQLARELLSEGIDDASVHAVLVHALGNLGRALEASAAADAAVARHPLDPELRYLAAALLLAAGRPYEAAESAAAVAYTDPGLAAGHLLLATIEQQLGRRGAATRSLERARELLAGAAPDAIVPLIDEPVADLLASVNRALESSVPR